MNILKLLILPFLSLFNSASKLFLPKNNLLELKMTFTDAVCSLKLETKNREVSDNLLIATFILFLGRYFFICDDRQVKPMLDFLSENLRATEIKSGEFASGTYGSAYNSLNTNEQDAVKHLFILGSPPMVFAEDYKDVSRKTAEYTIKISDQMGLFFFMSMGPDIVLLPTTLGILYEYVMYKISDKKNKELLNKLSTELITIYSTNDCRSDSGLNLPKEVLKKGGIKV